MELIREGNQVLLESIDRFHPTRNAHFAPYLTWALMRHFAQRQSQPTTPVPAQPRPSFGYWPTALHPDVAALAQAEQSRQALSQLMETLNEQEQFVITRHLGLGENHNRNIDPQTLADLSKPLNVRPDRARQIEHRALIKLREAAAQRGLSLRGLGLPNER